MRAPDTAPSRTSLTVVPVARPDEAATVPELVERRRQLVNEAGNVVNYLPVNACIFSTSERVTTGFSAMAS